MSCEFEKAHAMLHRAKHRRNPVLSPKLEAVIALLLAEVEDHRLYKTQAVKLPYLVDLVARHVLGQRVTEARYSAWDHGVVATEVYDFITDARFGGGAVEGTCFAVAEERGYEDRQLLVLEGEVPDRLQDAEREVVEFVAGRYGAVAPAELGRLTKSLNEHIERWPSAKAVRLNDLAYEKLPTKWDEPEAEIARRRVRGIEEDPARLVSGEELDEVLAKLLE